MLTQLKKGFYQIETTKEPYISTVCDYLENKVDKVMNDGYKDDLIAKGKELYLYLENRDKEEGNEFMVSYFDAEDAEQEREDDEPEIHMTDKEFLDLLAIKVTIKGHKELLKDFIDKL